MTLDDGAGKAKDSELDATLALSSELPESLTYKAVSGLSDTDDDKQLPNVSLEEFGRGLVETGLLDPVGLREVLSGLSASEQALGSEGLAQALMRQGTLTPYQAGALLQGKQRGLQIGPYLVLDKLGAGGMGTVLKARHQGGGPEIALKLLLPSASRHPTLVARFRREAEILDRIRHPNVVSCRAIDTYGGLYYLVMEYVKGRDFDLIVRSDGPMKVRTAIDCIIQAARGLLAAHEHGIVHRDIKPANLLLDAQRTVRVLDLGLARIVQGDDSGKSIHDESTLTRTGVVMGTVDFMAPEQSDDSKRADHRADIYSLGCTLFYLLTGRPPYSGETILRRVMAHYTQPIPSLCQARPDVPASLDAVFRAMLTKEPENRLQTMAEVIEKLESCRPSRSSPDSLLVIEDGKIVAKEPSPEPLTADDAIAAPKTVVNDPLAFLQNDPLGPNVGQPSLQPADRLAGKPSRKEPLVIGLAAAAAILVGTLIFVFRPAPSHKSPPQVVASRASPVRTPSAETTKSEPIPSERPADATAPPSRTTRSDTIPPNRPAEATAPASLIADTPKPAVAQVQLANPSRVPPTNQAISTEPEIVKTEAKASTPVANANDPPENALTEPSMLSGPERVLADKGLMKNGQRFLLEEASALALYNEARSKLSQVQRALAKRAAISEYDEAVSILGVEKQQLQMGANGVSSQIAENRSVLDTGVSGGGIRNGLIAANNALRQELSQIQQQIRTINQQLVSLKKQPPTDADREIASGFEKTRNGYVATIQELKSLVTPLISKYHELARDNSVTDALVQLHRDTNLYYKLGPSDELRAAEKLVKDLKVNTAVPKSKLTVKRKTSNPKNSATLK
jgi:serine/threonine protein kinase